MSDDLNWTVKAYNFVDGEYVLAAWICGLKQKKADETFDAWYATNKYAKIHSSISAE